MSNLRCNFDQDNGYEVDTKKEQVRYWVGNYREGGTDTVSFKEFLVARPRHWMAMASFSGKGKEEIKNHYKSICQYIHENTKKKCTAENQELNPEAQAWLSLVGE